MSENNLTKNKKNSNIIKFNEKLNCEILTENDINNLFFGLIKLIKRNVVFEKEKFYKSEINRYNNTITNYILEIDNKNTEIELLKKQLKKLNNKLSLIKKNN